MPDKLTKKEREWVVEVNEVMSRCPSDRLIFFAGGDPNIGIYLKKREQAVCDARDDVVRVLHHNGWLIHETIDFPGKVEAVCI